MKNVFFCFMLLVPGLVGATELPTPDFTTTARDIYAEFRPTIEAGQTTVKEKYTGKIVRIIGEVKRNGKMLGEHEVELTANDATGAAFLKIKPEASEEVLKYQKGQSVTLQCVSTGWLIGPSFKDCMPAAAPPAAQAPKSAP